MNERLKDFLQQIANDNENYGTSIKWFAQRVQSVCDFDKVMEMSLEELSELLIKVQPINARSVSYYLNVLNRYAEYIGNDKFIEISQGINTTEVWNRYNSSGERKRRYLSYSDFQTVLFAVLQTDLLNKDYYTTLLQSIYEGIYSDDMSALANLRGQDICGNVVTVRSDIAEPFELEISTNLADSLRKLARMKEWDRRNNHKVFPIPIQGRYPDSCFKVENRNYVADRNFKDCYYRYIRKIVEVTELDFPLRAKNLYISGIIYRVDMQLKCKGMTLEQTFAYKRRKGEDVEIVKKELERVHYPYVYRDFTKLVTGYISDFQDE